jgi:hypothetical protein
MRLSDARVVTDRPRAQHVLTGRLCCGVFLLTLAVYLMTASGHLQGPDQEYYYRMARAVTVERSFAVEPLPDVGGGGYGVDGRFYAQYAPGLPLALVPLVVIGQGLAGPLEGLSSQYPWGHQDTADLGARFMVSYFNGPITAATSGLLALLVLRLGYPPAAALFTALAFALATPAWGQARSVFPEPLQGLLLLVSCLLLLGATPARAFVGGTVLGLAMLVKLTSVLALPAFLLLPASSGHAVWRRPAAAAALLAPAVTALALHALYNLFRFGDPLTTAYYSGERGGLDFGGDLLVGLYGLLLSPGRGVLWYAPPVIVALLFFPRFKKKYPALGLGFIVLAVVWIVVHARWADWHGGWGWGPRYLLPILPLVLVPLAAAWLNPRARPLVLALAAVGAMVELPGATVDFMDWGSELLAGCSSDDCWYTHTEHFLNPVWSDILGHTQLLLAGRLDLAWITFGKTWLAPVTIGLTAALAYAGSVLLEPRPAGGARLASFKRMPPGLVRRLRG